MVHIKASDFHSSFPRTDSGCKRCQQNVSIIASKHSATGIHTTIANFISPSTFYLVKEEQGEWYLGCTARHTCLVLNPFNTPPSPPPPHPTPLMCQSYEDVGRECGGSSEWMPSPRPLSYSCCCTHQPNHCPLTTDTTPWARHMYREITNTRDFTSLSSCLQTNSQNRRLLPHPRAAGKQLHNTHHAQVEANN